MLITGTVVTLLSPVSLGAAMVFGALISATDPVAVIALFKELGAPRRLTMLVDGESLFNDATSIVAFDIMQALVISGVFSIAVAGQAAIRFVFVFFGGALVGATIGYTMMLFIFLARNDPLIEIAFSTAVAYAAFIISQYYLDLSGVMAVVGAGLVIGWYSPTRFTPATRQYMGQFWAYAAFVANSFIFLLLGLTEDFLAHSFHRWGQVTGLVACAVVSILLARAVVIFGLVPLINRLPGTGHINRKLQAVMYWGGLRGALPIGLAISLPQDFPFRTEIIELTLGVVLFTLLVQGTTISKLMHLLKLDQPSLVDRMSELKALLATRKEALHRVDTITHHWPVLSHDLTQKIKQEYRQEVEQAQIQLRDLHREQPDDKNLQRLLLWSQAITVARKLYHHYFERKSIGIAILREAEHNLDMLKDNIQQGKSLRRPYPSLPLGTRMAKHLFRLFVRLFPKHSLVLRGQWYILALEYERASTMADSCEKVLSEMQILADLCDAEPGMIEECSRFFKNGYDAAINKLTDLQQQHPEQMRQIQLASIHQEACDTKQQTLQKLHDNGGINTKIMTHLQQSIQEELNRYATAQHLKHKNKGST
jgi:CPA1 family monovalent cation:H+ antiporter